MNLWFRLLMHTLWRRRADLSPWDTAVTPFRVAPTDLDVLGHMNNGRFATLMDLGRADLMRRSGMARRARALGWYAVVAGQTITYRRSLTLGQPFALSTRVLGIDDDWFYMDQRFTSGDALVAHAIVRARFLKRRGGSVRIDEIETLLGEIPGTLQVPDWVREWTSRTRLPYDADLPIKEDGR